MTFYGTKEQHEALPNFYQIFPRKEYYEGMLRKINDSQNKKSIENSTNDESSGFEENWDIETLE